MMSENQKKLVKLFDAMTKQFLYRHEADKALTLAWNYVKHWLECECELESIGWWEWAGLYDFLQEIYETRFDEYYGVKGGKGQNVC